MITSDGKSKGGLARAKSLTPEKRTEIAKSGAAARWNNSIKKATHGSPDHPLIIGDIEIPCYVLEDETRVLSQRGLQSGIGMSLSGASKAGEQRLATFLGSLGQKGINIKDLSARITNPIPFYPAGGGRHAYGFEATILADICDVVLDARKNGILLPQQSKIADQCEILVRGFARVGIIALVDEVTGFQRDRSKDALTKILEAFIAKELQPWIKTFPADFYEQMFRLRDLVYPATTVKRPQYFGVLTNNIVYDRLAPGVRKELQEGVPRNEAGRPTAKYFQKLTQNTGYPKLREHLGSVVTLMKLSDDWDDFMVKLDKLHPPFNSTIPLDFDM